MKQETCIIGGGPVGCALGITLRRLGYNVSIYERYQDIRVHSAPGGRSINLVLTKRGLKLAKDLGLEQELLQETVCVRGRSIHSKDCSIVYQPYGRSGECNYSIDRSLLNKFWLSAADREGCRLVFDHDLSHLDPISGLLVFKTSTGKEVEVDTSSLLAVFGADGGGSAVRKSLLKAGLISVSEDLLSTGYKEVMFPSSPSTDTYSMDPHALHIWPRGNHMLMALANADGKTFTGTLFAERYGDRDSFASSTLSKQAASDFLSEHYSDALSRMDKDVTTDNFLNYTCGILGTVRSSPWTVVAEENANLGKSQSVFCLIGDAAHAIVPFFGQGVNCGFEDVVVLRELLGRVSSTSSSEFVDALVQYSVSRKVDTDAIARMAVENLEEMRTKVGDVEFRFLKKLDVWIMDKFPLTYVTRYALVMYSYNSYSVCEQYGERQSAFLDRVVETFGLSAKNEEETQFEKRMDVKKLQELIATHIDPVVRELGIIVSSE